MKLSSFTIMVLVVESFSQRSAKFNSNPDSQQKKVVDECIMQFGVKMSMSSSTLMPDTFTHHDRNCWPCDPDLLTFTSSLSWTSFTKLQFISFLLTTISTTLSTWSRWPLSLPVLTFPFQSPFCLNSSWFHLLSPKKPLYIIILQNRKKTTINSPILE